MRDEHERAGDRNTGDCCASCAEQREHCRGERNGGEPAHGHVSRRNSHGGPRDEREEGCAGIDHQHATEARCGALSSVEGELHRPDVPDHDEYERERAAPFLGQETLSEEYRDRPFEQIEQQRCDRIGLSAAAQDVARAGVAAAERADVRAGAEFREIVGGNDAAERVAAEDYRDDLQQMFSVVVMEGSANVSRRRRVNAASARRMRQPDDTRANWSVGYVRFT
jgi:hypothetical protein